MSASSSPILVVGLDYHLYRNVQGLLGAGRRLVMVREPTNTNDRNAIIVYLAEDAVPVGLLRATLAQTGGSAGETGIGPNPRLLVARIGYVARKDAQAIAPRLDAGEDLELEVVNDQATADPDKKTFRAHLVRASDPRVDVPVQAVPKRPKSRGDQVRVWI